MDKMRGVPTHGVSIRFWAMKKRAGKVNHKTQCDRLKCGHTFHFKCISEWFFKVNRNSSGNCPMCRIKIQFSNKYGIFNHMMYSKKDKITDTQNNESDEVDNNEDERSETWTEDGNIEVLLNAELDEIENSEHSVSVEGDEIENSEHSLSSQDAWLYSALHPILTSRDRAWATRRGIPFRTVRYCFLRYGVCAPAHGRQPTKNNWYRLMGLQEKQMTGFFNTEPVRVKQGFQNSKQGQDFGCAKA
jgi:hypothetical protein